VYTQLHSSFHYLEQSSLYVSQPQLYSQVRLCDFGLTVPRHTRHLLESPKSFQLQPLPLIPSRIQQHSPKLAAMASLAPAVIRAASCSCRERSGSTHHGQDRLLLATS